MSLNCGSLLQESRTSAKPTSQSKTGRDSRGIGTNPEVPELCWSVICLTSQYGNDWLLTLHAYTCLSTCQSPTGFQIHFCCISTKLMKYHNDIILFVIQEVHVYCFKLPFCPRFFPKTGSTPVKKIWRIVFLWNWRPHAKFMHFWGKKFFLWSQFLTISPMLVIEINIGLIDCIAHKTLWPWIVLLSVQSVLVENRLIEARPF